MFHMPKSIFILLVNVLLVFVGCSQSKPVASSDVPAPASPTETAAAEPELIIPVEARLPVRGPISSHLDTVSRVEAERCVNIMAEAVAECTQVNAEEGDRVEAGKILAELAKDDVLAAIGQAEVQVRQTKTSYEIAEQSFAEGIGSRSERDSARFAYEQATAALETHKVALDKRTIRAPISGIITKRNIQKGQMTVAGTPAFTLVDPESFILVVNVPEKERPRLAVGQTASCTIDALGDQTFAVTVRRINPGVDAASGTVKVVLDFDRDTRAALHEAAFARVSVVLDTHENALLVAREAIIEENARKYLFVVNTDGAAAAPVEAGLTEGPAEKKDGLIANRLEVMTGLEDAQHVEILSELPDDAPVVVLGQHALKPGAKVSITNANEQLMKNIGMNPADAIEAAKSKAAQAGQIK